MAARGGAALLACLVALSPWARPGAHAGAAAPAVAPGFLRDAKPIAKGSGAARATAAVTSALPFGHPSPEKEYPRYGGFTLWLVEEFDQPLDLDTDPIWTWSDGGLGESQVRFTKENLVFEDGKLKIVARDDGTSVQPQPQWCSYAETAGMPTKPLTSGELRTRYNMFRYGLYEARIKAPIVQPGNPSVDGNYISTMFVFRDAKFKHWREIDVEVTGNSRRSVTLNLLSAENTDAWSPNIQHTREFEADEDVDVRDEFHTYAFAWLPTGVTWYFDGKVVGHHGPDSLPRIPELSAKIMMNLWIFVEGYGFGGPRGENNRYPMHSEYDWFRFYKWDGDLSYPCADGGASCLTEDDMYLAKNNPCDGIEQKGLRGGAPSCVAVCPYEVEREASTILP